MIKHISSILIFIFLVVGLFAQGNRDLSNRVEHIYNLVQNESFAASAKEINILLKDYPDMSEYNKAILEAYYVISSIYLEKPNAEALLVELEKKHPYLREISDVKFAMADYLFNQANYSKSLIYLNEIGKTYLSNKDRLKFIYYRAFCNMRVGNNELAISGFKKMLTYGHTNFEYPSIYYLGYMNYLTRNFEDAILSFEKLEENDKYGLMSKYYILESKLMLKKYDEVIDRGLSLYEEVNKSKEKTQLLGDNRLKIARILSEAYYELGHNREAKNYMDIYSSSVNNLSRKDNYYAGIVSYSLNSYYSAIDAFLNVLKEEDLYSQSASFYIASSYLKLKNKHKAIEYFKSASNLDYDKEIKEEAYFNYAKLSFDLYSDISVFDSYLKVFPSSKKSDEIYHYLSTAFLLKKDYKSAILALGKIQKMESFMVQNLQKAAFFMAMKQFEKRAFTQAIENFKLAEKNGIYNYPLLMLTKYWLAESHYRIGNYAISIRILQELIEDGTFNKSEEYYTSYYNLAYSYFKTDKFEKAVENFKIYLEFSPNKRPYTREAQTRLADSYFMLRDYDRASELFELVASNNYDSDDIYASYQGAIAYGLINNFEKKINILNNITIEKPNSPLYSMAMYELGRGYIQADDFDKAKICYEKLVSEAVDSVYYAKALLELGMIYSNESNMDESLKYFDMIIRNAPLSAEAQNALAGIESIYQQQNRPDDFLAYLDNIGMSSVKSEDEKELMFFNSAEQLFLAGNYNAAYEALNSFIEKFPNGAKLPHIYFYLGETLDKLGKPESAVETYKKVMDIGEGAFVELSTLYYARLCYSMDNFLEAKSAYQSLYNIAVLENNKYESIIGIMRSSYRLPDYSAAINSAKELLLTEKGKSENDDEANYVIAKSFLALGKRNEALPILESLSKNTYSEQGAEASYLLILDTYDAGAFEAVENKVYSLSDSNTPHNYWLAKSFIVLGDSFAEREDWEQAKATFESILNGYSPIGDNDDVIDQVKSRLELLKNKMEN